MIDKPLFIYEEDTKQYKEMLEEKNQESIEISSALGSNVSVLNRDITNSVSCYNIEKQKFFQYKGKIKASESISMRAMENKINDTLKSSVYDNLEMDLYNALYKSLPTIHANDRMKEPLDSINNMIRDIVKNKDIEEIKRRTTMSPMQSLLAQENIYKQILIKYEEELKHKQKKLDNNNSIQSTKDIIDSLQGMPGSEGKIKELQNDLDNFNKIKDKLNAQDKNINEDASSKLDFNETSEKLDDAEDLFNGYGLDGADNVKMSDIDKKDVANVMRIIQNKKTIKRLLDMLGSMRDMAISITKKNVSKFGFVPTDVKIGNDIPKIIQSEKLLLAHDVTKTQFYKKYSEKQLLEYEMHDIQGKGPIVICRDISGSMQSNGRNEWACAITLSILQSAKIQNRDIYIINYNNIIKSETECLKGNKDLLNKSIEITLVRADGGTNFTNPLKRVFDIIKKSKFNKASILMLTDGDGKLDNNIFKLCKKIFKDKQVDMKTIFIGKDCGGSGATMLKELSSSSFVISDNQLMDINSYKDIAVNIFDTISK